MKHFKIILLTFLVAVACSEEKDIIPEISIFTPLTVEQLSPIVKTDTLFAKFYQDIRKDFDTYEDVEKARFDDVTYRGLYKLYKEFSDTAYLRSLRDTYKKDWDRAYLPYVEKADSILDYWQNYKKEHSLEQFASIEMTGIEVENYRYINDVKDVFFVFLL